MSVLGAIAGGVVGAAANIGGTAFQYYAQKEAQKKNKKNYKNRYLWQMEDMRNAGLNPILSYQQSPGSGAMAPSGQVGGGAAEAMARGSEVTTGLELSRARKKQQYAGIALMGAQAGQAQSDDALKQGQLDQARATTALVKAQQREQELYNVKTSKQIETWRNAPGTARAWSDALAETVNKWLPWKMQPGGGVRRR